MSLVKSMRRLFSGSGKAAALYERGLEKARLHNWAGAVEDYSAAIRDPKVSRDVLAMARFNRALAFAHADDQQRAGEDLRAVIAMPDAPANIRKAAKEKLSRWGKRSWK